MARNVMWKEDGDCPCMWRMTCSVLVKPQHIKASNRLLGHIQHHTSGSAGIVSRLISQSGLRKGKSVYTYEPLIHRREEEREGGRERQTDRKGDRKRGRERGRERVCNWAALGDKQTESIERLNKVRERWQERDGCRQDESTAAVSWVSEDTA